MTTGSNQENTGDSWQTCFHLLTGLDCHLIEWSFLQLVKGQLLKQGRFGYDALGEASKWIALQTFLTLASATLTSDETITWRKR